MFATGRQVQVRLPRLGDWRVSEAHAKHVCDHPTCTPRDDLMSHTCADIGRGSDELAVLSGGQTDAIAGPAGYSIVLACGTDRRLADPTTAGQPPRAVAARGCESGRLLGQRVSRPVPSA